VAGAEGGDIGLVTGPQAAAAAAVAGAEGGDAGLVTGPQAAMATMAGAEDSNNGRISCP
jgi:hypothetical protein